MPKTVIWAGVGVALAGGILVATAPLALNAWWAPNTTEWLSAIGVLEIVVAIARTVLAPLGAALIAGGLVMVYIDRRLRGDGISDRPRRWRFPPPQDA
ncbi:hypothetical protein [Agromyces binzhouensis]|uniref:Uncharacterized protein n=1 Tax=Agromyces binzhouensis TaxID=1817495 RepID=A0A4Q2JYI6_9MICO|nr:hypothetical protein [Agromyces binzhouensis]RXZ51859.1 hypothetical protein ESO86_00460 [Agromyces binzhouensis]